MNKKIRVGIIFGGKSSEHEVSLLSAKTIFDAIDKEKYEPVLIAIDKEGKWYLKDHENFLVDYHNPKKVSLTNTTNKLALIPGANLDSLVSLSKNETTLPIDVAFPIVHGTNGEDGTIQGLLKLSGIPFVGAGVLGSAVGMDKDVMKRLLRDAGIPLAEFITIYDYSRNEFSFEDTVNRLGLPLFIKPANNGSSIGVSKVKNEEEFMKAIQLAFRYDRKVLIEKFINGREVECSVIGNEDPIASLPGELVPQEEFNSWDAKYLDDLCKFIIPASISFEKMKEVQDLAIKVYKVLCCEGMARVDFFLSKEGSLIVNEINTLPGFTKLSVFPRLWEASGVSYTELVDRIIQYAIQRHINETKLLTSSSVEALVN